jgi:spore cortex formation protein SpoVR/YcgB (stage V sporulation)
MTMQALVIAHACYGHNSFFKGNYLFRTWTDAESIIDYLLFSKSYIAKCEQRHGGAEVEKIIDSCHALMSYGVDRYKRPYPISAAEEVQRQEEREIQLQKQVNDLWRTIPNSNQDSKGSHEARFPSEPEENLLYFIEKHAPLLEPWQREVIRIIRKTAQYFYPQRQTQLMNEGWATYWHYTLLNEMYDRGLVNDGFMMEFLQSHSGVIHQPSFDSGHYNGINPYALGFAMMGDIRRICENPSQEDRYWFPEYAGRDWLETLHLAMRDFKDESFVMQYLSPNMMRQFKLFSIVDDDLDSEIEVNAIHDESGYRAIRENLSTQYNLQNREPNIQVHSVDIRGDRSICLHHIRDNRRPLESSSAEEVLKHVHRLWGFPARLLSFESDNNGSSTDAKQSFHCPPTDDLYEIDT